jgi:hypothetical protein
VTESIGGGGELVGNARIHVRLIITIEADRVVAKHGWQEFIVGDRLDLSRDNHSGEFIDFVASELGVLLRYRVGPGIVLTHEQGMHGRESDLLIGAEVSSEEEVRTVGRSIVETVYIERQKVPFAGLEASAAVCRAQLGRRVLRRNRRRLSRR